jgi:hypothetical protein
MRILLIKALTRSNPRSFSTSPKSREKTPKRETLMTKRNLTKKLKISLIQIWISTLRNLMTNTLR